MAVKKKQSKDIRVDSYQEIFLNVGTAGDPFNYGGIGRPKMLTRMALERVYAADGIGRRIVDIVPEEMFRTGFDIEGVPDMRYIRSRWDELNATNKLIDALCWDRLYGGAIIVMGIDDGSASLDAPAGDGEVTFLRVYDRHQVTRYATDMDPNSPTFGETLIYEIHPVGGTMYRVHASRCIIFDGQRVPDHIRQHNDGWGASILQGVTGALKDFGISHQMATSLLSRKQQGVWKVNDLSSMCRDTVGKRILKERLNQVDMTRSNNNSIALDAATEDYVLLTGDLNGVTDVIQEKKSLLFMITGIHESILSGENVSGINANENTALASFHQLVGRAQVDIGRPAIERIVSRMIPNINDWKITFNPLAIETASQRADRILKESQADKNYRDAEILDDDEIRDTMRKRGDYQIKDGAPTITETSGNTPEDDERILNG